jgi:hypothetical protein
MTAKLVGYWISTVLVAAMMAFSAYMYLSRNPQMMAGFASLGYPGYFSTILGVAKALGVCALLAPRFGLLKEWAYAGFTFTFIGAAISHLSMAQGPKAVAPLVALLLLAISYLLRPASRRIAASSTIP